MKKLWIASHLLFCCLSFMEAQKIALPMNLPEEHPRVLTNANEKRETKKLIQEKVWAKEVFNKLKQRTDKYVDLGPEWLTSRLMMYWNSHATDVYIKGEFFDHAGGEKAPVPTVMLSGARSHATKYGRPKLEEMTPYQEDPKGLYLANNSLEGSPKEWAAISQTGNQIQSINNEILGYAKDAAFLWWLTRDKKYGELATSVFDTYMQGIYYRNVPKDLNHGHQQTLVGMTSFEVIHEDALSTVVVLYDFLYDYLKKEKSDKMDIYAEAFKKWANNIIDNGVPHNNWDLLQAHSIFSVGLILEDNEKYADGKGRGYYLNYVLNQSSIRQWSLTELANYGFDKNTGIWGECPGYGLMVVNEYANFARVFDRCLDFDLVKALPIIEKAVAVAPEYTFPNGKIVGFGDTHPSFLRTDFFESMIRNAQKYGKKEEEKKFTSLLKLFNPSAEKIEEPRNIRVDINSFFGNKPLVLDASVQPGKLEDFVSPLFYAPNVSWLVQRNGTDPQHSLMISQNASESNHQHANGISMELYGKGLTLAPDAGIGLTSYSGLDYQEYYGQFPSHNTVCVDGISSYPIMKSNHAFEVNACYPRSEVKKGIYRGISYSEVAFREPESRADQTRLMSIVTTGDKTGYYVDIFRSRKEKGGDKMHDYFYHNLGQNMTLTAADGSDLNLQPTEELAFAGAHLYAYSYIYNKRSATTSKDIKATFKIHPDKGGDDIWMTMWQKGDKNREVFQALSPITEGLSRDNTYPYSIKDQPTLTFVARQQGEAWNHPFVSIFEPSCTSEPSNIASVDYFNAQTNASDFVGICVENKNERTDYIFSSAQPEITATYKDMTVKATYALIGIGEKDAVFFLGNGIFLKNSKISIRCQKKANVAVENKNGNWYYTADAPCQIDLEEKSYELIAADYQLLR